MPTIRTFAIGSGVSRHEGHAGLRKHASKSTSGLAGTVVGSELDSAVPSQLGGRRLRIRSLIRGATHSPLYHAAGTLRRRSHWLVTKWSSPISARAGPRMRPRNVVVSLLNAAPPVIARRFRGDGILASLLRPIANLSLPNQPTSITVRAGAGAGLRLVIDPRHEKYYWSGLYEPRAQDAIVEHLTRGDVMWDVGAHIGFLSAIAARAVGPTGHVVAFEPLPANVVRLTQTVEMNGLSNVSIRDVAVSSSVGTGAFHVNPSSTMGGLAGTGGGERIEVQTTTLDAELDVSLRPRLVKIDVEGFEDEVLAGAQGLFTEVRPFLIIELLTEEAVARAQSLLPRYALRRIDEMNFVGDPTG